MLVLLKRLITLETHISLAVREQQHMLSYIIIIPFIYFIHKPQSMTVFNYMLQLHVGAHNILAGTGSKSLE